MQRIGGRVHGAGARRLLSVRCLSQSARPISEKYLQSSPVASTHFQSSLPRLPVPKLENTLDRYVKALQPLIPDDVLAAHMKAVEDFRQNDGPKLQQQLIEFDKANKHTSYITDAWFDMYLRSRDPLPVNFNPYIGLEMDRDPAKNTQLNRAATLIRSSVRFMNSMRDQQLKPDVYHMNPAKTDNATFFQRAKWLPGPLRWLYAYSQKVFPLDMSQYGRLFNSTRLPKEGKDELWTGNGARHIAVLHRGRVYQFDVVAEDGTPLPVAEIKANLAGILADSRPATADPVGVLTTQDRDTWARVRSGMETHERTRAGLAAVDSALFVVALDDHVAGSEAAISQQMLYGDGRNRWFDKSFTLIVLPNGMAAVNFEHAWGDGVAVLRYVNEVWADANATPAPTGSESVVPAREIDFAITPAMRADIAAAATAFDRRVAPLNFQLKMVGPMGKQQLKTCDVGTDGACQFAFQLGYLRLYGATASTYESCSTAAFKHGRTETIRPNTIETLAAARAFLDPNATREEKLAKFRAANRMHSTLTKNAATGQGFDRHMFMLRRLGEATGHVPGVFTDHACYQKLGHVILSTSTLQSPAIMSGGFGPVAADGFGLGYSLFDDTLGLHITDYRGHASALLEAIEHSWADLADMLGVEVLARDRDETLAAAAA